MTGYYDAGGGELLVHPALGLVGIRRERGRVENPRLWRGALLRRRQVEERRATSHGEILRVRQSEPAGGRGGLGLCGRWRRSRGRQLSHEVTRRVLDHAQMGAVDPAGVHPFGVGREVDPDGAHRQRRAAQQLQVVGDVARAAAELPPHLRHEERDVQDMDLVRQDVVLEAVLEDHDVVVGERATDQRRHGMPSG